jgi:hypothetical protein
MSLVISFKAIRSMLHIEQRVLFKYIPHAGQQFIVLVSVGNSSYDEAVKSYHHKRFYSTDKRALVGSSSNN